MNHELRATSILSLMDTTKDQRRSFAEQVITEIEMGSVNPLLIHCQIKAMESLLSQFLDKGELKERYMKLVIDEAAKHPKKFEFHSGTFETKEAGVKYDYSQCNDPVMLDLLAKQADLKIRIDTRAKLLQSIQGHMDIVDQHTGEVHTLYPPAKTSTTTVSVTLK